MVIYQVPETERALRERLRLRLAWFGFGPLSPSVWLSPHNRSRQVIDDFADYPAAQLDSFRSRSAGNGADRDIAARAWDLAALERDYRDLLARYSPRLAGYRSGCSTSGRRWWNGWADRRLPALSVRDPNCPPSCCPTTGRAAAARGRPGARRQLRAPAERAVAELAGVELAGVETTAH